MKNSIKVVELFAGVGGFRLGLEKSSSKYNTIWANQWEPNKKVQHAFDCYVQHFGETPNHVNKDIHTVLDEVPEHDLLVGGFPCQDYSVARTQAKGIEGKKGVLWWDINEIVKSRNPKYIVLENVDRLLKSPSSQRGRDFGIMLRSLNDLGYAVEWRVINAAEYGFTQRRRRVFIFAFRNDTDFYKNLETKCVNSDDNISALRDHIMQNGFFTVPFKLNTDYIYRHKPTHTRVISSDYPDLVDVSDNFHAPFYNAGIAFEGEIYSEQTEPIIKPAVTLREIRHKEEVDSSYFLSNNLEKWKYLKGAKSIDRIRPNGEPYKFSEGNMCFPDNLDAPARTMLTSESSVNRSSHVIEDAVTGKLRKLTPIECERLNGFDDNWTNTGMPHRFRYFCMGNALVVPIITVIGDRLLEIY